MSDGQLQYAGRTLHKRKAEDPRKEDPQGQVPVAQPRGHQEHCTVPGVPPYNVGTYTIHWNLSVDRIWCNVCRRRSRSTGDDCSWACAFFFVFYLKRSFFNATFESGSNEFSFKTFGLHLLTFLTYWVIRLPF